MHECRARHVHYLAFHASIAATNFPRGDSGYINLPAPFADSADEEKAKDNCSDEVPLSAESSFAHGPERPVPIQPADGFLYDDTRPGYAGRGMARSSDDGISTLSRELPGRILCFKITFVNEGSPYWNIPLEAVEDLGAWLNCQFLALQSMPIMSKPNPIAITHIDQIWGLLARFDTTAEEKSILIRATPIEMDTSIPMVELSIVWPITSPEAASFNPNAAMMPQGYAMNTPSNMARLQNQNALPSVSVDDYQVDSGQPSDKLLQSKNEAQEAEITRLTTSVKQYGQRMRLANNDIRELRGKLRDSEQSIRELQQKYRNALSPGKGSVSSKEVSASSLIAIQSLVCMKSSFQLGYFIMNPCQ